MAVGIDIYHSGLRSINLTPAEEVDHIGCFYLLEVEAVGHLHFATFHIVATSPVVDTGLFGICIGKI